MKILLPFEIKDIGGTATFAAKFRDRVSFNGHTVLNHFQWKFDTLFIIADCPLWIPMYAKLTGKKVVQRLDGVYHLATPAGRLYPIYNLKMRLIHNFLADAVIYQSQFSKDCCEKFLGETAAKQTTIIYNGVDVEKIPRRDTSLPIRKPIKLLTFAKFRRRDQIEPILESVKLLGPESYSLDIYGSYTENLQSLFESLPDNIRFMGKQTNETMLQLLSQYDIFLFSDQSACPNSVLEAMAAGLPTIAFSRGSIPELIESGYNGEIVAIREHSDPFTDSYPFAERQYAMFADAVTAVTNDIVILSTNSHERTESRYNLPAMIRSYETLLTKNT
ncbi:MAG: glycosyltransferase family 4 protein [Candidatus Moraniibacteriota bacterium]